MRFAFGMIAALLLAVSLGGCRSHYSWHQKLTLVVETPQGTRSGSSVVRVDVLYGQLPLMAGDTETFVTGEAAIVDLGQGKYLFALLMAEDDGGLNGTVRLAEYTWRDQITGHGKERLSQIANLKGVRELPRKYYPLLVTFKNINDPETIEQVNPDDLENSFGPGYSLKSITLEVTEEPVTTGVVEKLLPCLKMKKECISNKDVFPFDTTNRIKRRVLNIYFRRNRI